MKDLKEEMRKQELCVTGGVVTNLLPFSFFSVIRDPVAQSLDQIAWVQALTRELHCVRGQDT